MLGGWYLPAHVQHNDYARPLWLLRGECRRGALPRDERARRAPPRARARGAARGAAARGGRWRALTLLAAVLRLSTLDLQSFWYDEAFTPVHVLHPSLAATLRSMVAHGEHPAALVHARVGRLARARHRRGRAAAAVGARRDRHGARRLGDRQRAGRAAARRSACAALVAVNPLFVWYSQEARAYALFVLHGVARDALLPARLREPTRGAPGGRSRSRARWRC